jgi:anti-sigma-K factor RskA
MTERPDENRDEELLAAVFALGLLEGSDREAFVKRIAQNPALVAEVRYWSEQFAAFADDIVPVTPSDTVQSQIESRLFGVRQRPQLWHSVIFWRGLAAASLVAFAALAFWSLQIPAPPQQDILVAQIDGEAKAVKLVAFYDASTGQLRLNRTAGTAAPNRSFELWLIIGSDAPVSLGVLPTEPTIAVNVPEHLRSKLNGSVLAISDEPAGGSPTGAPTGPVLGTGLLTAV